MGFDFRPKTSPIGPTHLEHNDLLERRSMGSETCLVSSSGNKFSQSWRSNSQLTLRTDLVVYNEMVLYFYDKFTKIL